MKYEELKKKFVRSSWEENNFLTTVFSNIFKFSYNFNVLTDQILSMMKYLRQILSSTKVFFLLNDILVKMKNNNSG